MSDQYVSVERLEAMMSLTLLRKGFAWRIPSARSGQDAAKAFRAIARAHGSKAVWLPQSGVVCTDDDTERLQNLPYENWRSSALEALKANRISRP